MQYIILGGGCFWCIEAVFNLINGVTEVKSGYTDGNTINPEYKDICEGNTGHVEAVKVSFDEDIISLEEILEIFWVSHDPTTLNRQGNDIGTQYRSAIFYNKEDQLPIIQESLNKVASEIYSSKIVTEIKPETTFYEAESYHQNYFSNNATQPYCAVVISPKVNKIRQKYSARLKS